MEEPLGARPFLEQSISPEEQLRVTAKPDDGSGFVVLHLAGDLDLYTAGVLREQLLSRLQDGTSGVVIDLTELGFLGSAGLAELVSAQDTATRNDVRLMLVASSRNVLRPLEVTGLRSTFRVYETVPAALAEV
jgi:anti-sigma B factor antagonist